MGADWGKAKTVWIDAARFNTEKDVHSTQGQQLMQRTLQNLGQVWSYQGGSQMRH